MTEGTDLDPDIVAAVRSSFARQGLMRSIGADLIELAVGHCAIALPFAENVSQQHGFFHGGIIGAVADSAGGYAALSCAPPGSEVLTLEYKINFLRPAVGERLVARASVLRAGRTVAATRVDVTVGVEGQEVLCAALQQSIVIREASKA